MNTEYAKTGLEEAKAEVAKARDAMRANKVGSYKWCRAADEFEFWTSKKAHFFAMLAPQS